MIRKLINRRLFMIGVEVNEMEEYKANMSFDGQYIVPYEELDPSTKNSYKRLEKEQEILYEESRYLNTLRDIGYIFYEDDTDEIDINDRLPSGNQEPKEFVEVPVEKNINQLYIDYRNVKNIMERVSIAGIINVFKNSSSAEQLFFIKKLDEYSNTLKSNIIRVNEPLTIFKKKKSEERILKWFNKLNDIKTKMVNDKFIVDVLIKRLKNYVASLDIKIPNDEKPGYGEK